MSGEMNTSADNPTLQAQLDEAGVILQKSAAYVAETQPQLDKAAAFNERFMKRAHEVAGVLVDRGIIPAGESNHLVEKLAEDKVLALDLVARLARIVGPDALGKQADDVSTQVGRQVGPFEALCLYDDPSKTDGDGVLTL